MAIHPLFPILLLKRCLYVQLMVHMMALTGAT
jgi:hypothetical protein